MPDACAGASLPFFEHDLAHDDFSVLLTIWSWLFRYIHITLDVFVLYGVLREKSKDVDERADGARTGGAGSSGQPVSRSPVCTGSAASAVANEPHDVVASSA